MTNNACMKPKIIIKIYEYWQRYMLWRYVPGNQNKIVKIKLMMVVLLQAFSWRYTANGGRKKARMQSKRVEAIFYSWFSSIIQ
jgi:hypothetical protein